MHPCNPDQSFILSLVTMHIPAPSSLLSNYWTQWPHVPWHTICMETSEGEVLSFWQLRSGLSICLSESWSQMNHSWHIELGSVYHLYWNQRSEEGGCGREALSSLGTRRSDCCCRGRKLSESGSCIVTAGIHLCTRIFCLVHRNLYVNPEKSN